MEEIIVINRVQCRKCGSTIVSEFDNDFKRCECGAIAIDGGREYLKRMGKEEYINDLSIKITNEDLKNISDLKGLIDELNDCDNYIQKLSIDYYRYKDEATDFSNNTYNKHKFTDSEIVVINTAPFPTNYDDRTQLFINLNAVKKIVIEIIMKKKKITKDTK